MMYVSQLYAAQFTCGPVHTLSKSEVNSVIKFEGTLSTLLIFNLISPSYLLRLG